MRRPARTAALVALALLAAASAAPALTRREAACQAAIARAGRRYLAAELASRARCRMRQLTGRTCAAERSARARAVRVQLMLARCHGVALGRLNGGGCAEAAAHGGVRALAACLVERHGAAVDVLVLDQFGPSLADLPR